MSDAAEELDEAPALEAEAPAAPAEEEERKHTSAFQKRYQQRITIARNGQEAYEKDDYMNAVKFYNQYLKILCDLHFCKPEDITPAMFDQDKDVAELMVISHVYWDLAKLYDLTPKMYPLFKASLEKFVIFSIDYPYQVLNAEIIRKFIRKGKFVNGNDFKRAQDQISVTSKKCYIATACYGENHYITEDLRVFKKFLHWNSSTIRLIDLYYSLSTRLLAWQEKHPKAGHIQTKYFFKPLIRAFHFIVKPLL